MSITLAIDTMGGDSAPQIVFEGIKEASKIFNDLKFLLFGPEPELRKWLDNDPSLQSICEIFHAEEKVTSETTISIALRGLKQSSMRLAILAVSEGRAQGVVSAGNTGAYMALSKLILRTLEGIHRPAIAGILPNLKGQSVVMDLGANIEVSAENLVQFCLMGTIFARNVLKIENPSVGLLNIGQEDLKGHEKIKLAQQLLKSNPVIKNFYGFIEGDDISYGTTDVVVTDGFTGNVALKAIEGTAKLLTRFMREEIEKSFLSRCGALLAYPAFNALKKKLDPQTYNGAPFLGLQGIAVKSHGAANGVGFASAISVAYNLIKNELNHKITSDISVLSQYVDSEKEKLATDSEKGMAFS